MAEEWEGGRRDVENLIKPKIREEKSNTFDVMNLFGGHKGCEGGSYA